MAIKKINVACVHRRNISQYDSGERCGPWASCFFLQYLYNIYIYWLYLDNREDLEKKTNAYILPFTVQKENINKIFQDMTSYKVCKDDNLSTELKQYFCKMPNNKHLKILILGNFSIAKSNHLTVIKLLCFNEII
jgi:hypothetical protein